MQGIRIWNFHWSKATPVGIFTYMKKSQFKARNSDLYEAILLASERGHLWGLDRSRTASQTRLVPDYHQHG